MEKKTETAGFKSGTKPSGTTSGQYLTDETEPIEEEPQKPTRFHGTVDLNPSRAGRDAGKVADEVISHLAGLVGSKVKVTLEIEAEISNGVPDNIIRVVTENCRTLNFSDQGFEKE
jgi:hypothetical protein